MPALRFLADHPDLRSAAGVLSDRKIRIESRPGCGLYGPYIDLPAGIWIARIHFDEPPRGRAHMDVCTDVGATVLALRRLDFDAVEYRTAELAVILPGPTTACEVRLFCEAGVHAVISAVEFELSDGHAGVERAIRLQLGNGIDGPNTDIRKGRDIAAGYARGTGLEFGGLRRLVELDPDWIAACEATRGRSIIDLQKLMNLFLIIKYSNTSEGNIIEFGSFRGGGALFFGCLAKRLRKNCKVFALDTYEGMPATDTNLDRHSAGTFDDVDLAGFERARAEDGLDNLFIIKGLFHQSVQQIPPDDRCFFLSHIDCDIYDSMVFSLEFAKRHAVDGSYIVLDDPLTADCLGAMQAAEECLVQQGLFAEQAYPHLVYRYPPLPSRD